MRVLSPDRREGRLRQLRLRLEVLRRRPELDRALADGVNPAADPALALRARQLTEPSTGRAVATTIGNLLDAADEPPGAWALDGPRPPLQGEAVRAARYELLAVADRFREPGDISPQAAALAALLVWDPASPIYTAGTDTTVEEIARAAQES